MADNRDSIFGGVNDAINKNKRRTPQVENPGVIQQNAGLIQSENNIEHVQQQFLDWQVNKIAHDLYTRTIYYDTDRVNAYQDFRAMDMSPEIASALNIMRDECLEANTIIPLLNGEKITIEELYNRGNKDFYVYSYNSDNNRVESAKCERVVYKGEQNVYKVIFDDNSFVMATSEHMWLIKGENKYVTTSELSKKQSIEPFYTRISTSEDRINGYKNWKIFFSKFNSKEDILDGIKRIVLSSGVTNLSKICKEIGVSRKKIDGLISRSKYKNWNNYLSCINHSIKSIEFIGKRKTYDLVNVGEHHNFAVLTSNGTGVFTHNCITIGEKGKILDIFSENERVKTVLQDLFYNRLDIDFALKLWIRDLLKYGDLFLHLHIDASEGIYNVLTLPSEEIHREEGFEGKTDNVRFRWETTGDYFEDWQVAHFRLLEDTRKLPYGRCLKYNTYIETDSGVKFIKDIKKGDVVSCFDIDSQKKVTTKVLDVVCSGEKEIFKIRTKNNELETSAEHKIFIHENGKFIYKSADELSIGDLLIINSNTITNDEIKIDKNLKEEKTSDFILTPIISIEKLEDKEEVYDIHVENENHNFYANGIVVHNSILDPARKLWKQLQLAEDSMLVYRITRAPERRVFYIDVGNLEHADVGQFIGQFQMQLKKQPIVDQRTGNINMKYNPMNVTEDYFIPMRADRSSRIETLPGACLSLDTRIPLLDGRTLELNEIIKEWDNGNKDMWVYSCDPKTGEASVGPITWAGVTRKNTQVLKITLDNGKTVIATPDHKFVHRTKGFVEAENLIVGDSLMPFYKDKKKIKSNTNSDYEIIWDSHKEEWLFTHRIVTDFLSNTGLIKEFLFDSKYDGKDKKIRHHIDLNRFNNNPNNIVWMNGGDNMRLHQSVIMETIWKNPEENKKKIKNGINKFIKSQTKENREIRNQQSVKNLKNANKALQVLLEDSDYKKEFYEKISKSLKKIKGTKEARIKQSKFTKNQWKKDGHKEKVFNKKQTLTFTETLYNMYFDMFKKTGRADLALKELNKSIEFLDEFVNNNKKIRSSLTNLNEFTHNHLEKMLKERGFKNYIEWHKITASELGYKNIRAWKYYIDKENKKEKFYNHKITSIEWLDDKIDTGTITVDGEEKLQVNHTFALESGIYIKNSNLGDIQDIEYFQNKLFASLQVPKNYLNYGESLPGGSTLSQQDLRFSRTINTIQQAVLAELKRVANIHLYFNGFKDDVDNFTLTLTNPSTQQELLKLETMKARIEVFKEMFSADATSPVSYVWAMENILGFSKNEIKLILKQKKVEKKIFAEIDSAVEMYKKIGFFKDLDEKFEIEGAEEMMAAQQSGEDEGGEDFSGGGGGSSFGGGDFGAAEELPGEAGVEAGVEVGGEVGEEIPQELSENKFNKFNKVMNISDRHTNNLINELLGEDEFKSKKNKIEDNALIKRGNTMKSESKRLIKRISDSIVNREKNKEIIQEDSLTNHKNSLIEGSENIKKDNKNLMGDIEKYLRNRKQSRND